MTHPCKTMVSRMHCTQSPLLGQGQLRGRWRPRRNVWSTAFWGQWLVHNWWRCGDGLVGDWSIELSCHRRFSAWMDRGFQPLVDDEDDDGDDDGCWEWCQWAGARWRHQYNAAGYVSLYSAAEHWERGWLCNMAINACLWLFIPTTHLTAPVCWPYHPTHTNSTQLRMLCTYGGTLWIHVIISWGCIHIWN